MTGSDKKVTYRLKFEVPVAFVDVLNDAATTEMDVYWNEKVVCRMAKITGINAKPDAQTGDLVWFLSLAKDRQASDMSYPSIEKEVNDAGDLRLHALQLTLPS